jgi:hypothetical protein
MFVYRRFAPVVSDITGHQRCRFLSGKQVVSDCSFAVETLSGTRSIFLSAFAPFRNVLRIWFRALCKSFEFNTG